MIFGVTGHQRRPGVDWNWVRGAIRAELARNPNDLVGLSSLAQGADQIFAEEVLARGGRLVAVIPLSGYERYFEGAALTAYLTMLERAEVIGLPGADDPSEAFLAAGIYVADHCQRLIAVWDGKAAEGKGGAADVVAHARATGRPTCRLDPIGRTTEEL